MEKNKFRRKGWLGGLILLMVLAICVCVGSVDIPLWRVLETLAGRDTGYQAILLTVRLPRVLCAMLAGAALALSGGAMQGLLQNPLADGSTLGVSSGASLGAALAIAGGGALGLGVTGLAIVFALGTLVLVLSLARWLDASLSTYTIILIGIVTSLLATSLISLITVFAGERLRQLTFWTLGSLAGVGYGDAGLLALALLVFGGGLLFRHRELNAFALGEENARSVGVDVKVVRVWVLVCAAGLIGVTVAIGGGIGFVGLVVPHMARRLVGPEHSRLLPASAWAGAVFLMLADLVARTALRPLELPIGAVTSLVGTVVFLWIFVRTRRP